jgi:surface antigen
MKEFFAVLALTLALGACAQPGDGYGPSQAAPGGTGLNRTTGGAGLDAVADAEGEQGSGKLAMTTPGVLAGGLVGVQIGKSLDEADVAYANRTAQRGFETAPTGQSVAWTNPDTGNRGTITPTRTYQMPGGQYCREFTHTVTVRGHTQEGIGTACRQPDGSWQIQN